MGQCCRKCSVNRRGKKSILDFVSEGFPYSGNERPYNRQTGNLIFSQQNLPNTLVHSDALQNFQEFGSSFVGFSSKFSLIGGGRYSLSLVTIVIRSIISSLAASIVFCRFAWDSWKTLGLRP